MDLTNMPAVSPTHDPTAQKSRHVIHVADKNPSAVAIPYNPSKTIPVRTVEAGFVAFLHGLMAGSRLLPQGLSVGLLWPKGQYIAV